MATSPTELDIPAPLLDKLTTVRQRKVKIGIGVTALLALTVLFAAMAVSMLMDWTLTLVDPTWRFILLLLTLFATIFTFVRGMMWTIRQSRALTTIAADVDREVPHLEERWSTVTEISARNPAARGNIHPAMMSHVIDEAIDWAPHVTPHNIISWRKVRLPLTVLAVIAVVLMGAMLVDGRQTAVLMGRFWLPNAEISMTKIAGPQDLVVARGEELSIHAELSGRPVDEALILIRSSDNNEEQQLLFPRGDAPQTVRFRQRAADDSFEYRIRAGDGQSEWHSVIVADRPQLSAVTVQLKQPAYTRREDTELRNLPEKLSAVEGSNLEVAFLPDGAVRSLELQFGEDETVSLKADANGWYRWQTVLEQSLAFSPILTEPNGLTNNDRPVCRVDVVADLPPEVQIITPSESAAVRPNDTIDIEFEAKDDFGVSRAELIVYDESELDGGEPKEILSVDIPLDLTDDPTEVRDSVQLDLSKLELQDGQSISYAVRVYDTRDLNSEGTPNPSTTPNLPNDEYVAEATEFDSIETGESQADSSPESQQASSTASSEPLANESEDRQSNRDSGGSAPSKESQSNEPPPRGSPESETTAAPSPPDMTSGNSSSPSPSSPISSSPSSSSPSSSSPSSSSPSSSSPSSSSPSSSSPSSSSPSSSSPNSSSPSSSSPSSSSPSSSSSSSPSSSSSTNRPADNMTRRSMNVGSSQAGSSGRRSLTIDRWAGRFDGQSREKLELSIAPVIEEIDGYLADAESAARKLLDGFDAGTSWQDTQMQQLQSTDESLEKALKTIEDLAAKTRETPYAFVGLTLVDIGDSHVSPAREEFRDAKQADDSGRPEPIRSGWRYVQRARQLLAALSRQYEKVRRDFQLAESVERIKNMYQVFIENSHALLGGGGPDDLGGLQRKMAEFELDEEYLQRLKEVLEMRQEMMAEFARMLSDDPRLLRRYMDRLRVRTKTLRYELAELTDRQKALAREVRAYEAVDDQQREGLQRTILKQRLMEVEEISTAAAELNERFLIWLPLDIEIEDGSLAESRDLTSQVAASAQELLASATGFGGDPSETSSDANDLNAISRQAEEMSQQLNSLDAALRRVSIEDDRQDLASHQLKRLAETQNLISQTDGWIRKISELAKGNYHLAAEVDQHELTSDTALLTGKLSDIEAQLEGNLQSPDGALPESISEKAKELLVTLDEEVATNQLSSVYALREAEMSTAVKRQSQAVDAMLKAEQQLQELLTMAIQEMDKLPVQDPLASALEDPTLDELLAALEQELESADDLGIPPRPNNLNIVNDMTMPGQGQQGQGAGMMGAGMQLGTANQELQQMLERAYQEALGRALKEKRRTRQSAKKHLRRLPIRGAKRWLVGSQLGDDLLQGSGKMAPEQYRQAIEQYFEQISQLRETQKESSE